jgi:fluoroquinolone resistance protein
MNRLFTEGKKIENLILHDKPLIIGDYENCSFINCDFSEANLSDLNFLECEFIGCNLSLVKLNNTSLREVKFKKCKLLGLHFEDCNNLLITIDFEDCILNISSFFKLNLKRTRFINSKIIDVDFTETDLNKSIFENCDLKSTTFQNTNLEGADFRSSYNYSIDPELNRIKKAKFSIPWIAGLLDKYDIDIEK